MNKNKLFLIDSSALLAPYRQYYAFDLVPSFWPKLQENLKSGKIVILDRVWDELSKGGESDKLSKWLDDIKPIIHFCSYKNETTISNYTDVLRYLQSSDLYLNSALTTWSRDNVADPWLIATAKTGDYIIVTEEQGSKGISIKQKNREAKIPDVAKALDVETVSLFEMMRRLKISI